MAFLLNLPGQLLLRLCSFLNQAFCHLTQPSRYSIVLSTTADLTRSKAELIAENALLRQQLIALRVHRQVEKPRFTHNGTLIDMAEASDLPPEIEQVADVLSNGRPELRDLFRYALVLGMIDDEKARVIGRRMRDG